MIDRRLFTASLAALAAIPSIAVAAPAAEEWGYERSMTFTIYPKGWWLKQVFKITDPDHVWVAIGNKEIPGFNHPLLKVTREFAESAHRDMERVLGSPSWSNEVVYLDI